MLNSKSDSFFSATAGTVAERREAAERELKRRSAERQKFIAAQTSPHYDPKSRIRLWEQLHGLHLPSNVGHRLVLVIAAQTALTIDEVRHEQLRRASATNPSTASESGV